MTRKKKSVASEKGFHADLEPPRDSHIPNSIRNRPIRWIAFILSVATILGIPTLIVGYWGMLLGNASIGQAIGLCIGGVFLSQVLFTRLLVYVPEWRAYVTHNMLTGAMVPYGPGLHPALATEQRNEEDDYPLTPIPVSFDLPNLKCKVSSIRLKGKGEYAISLRHITRAIGTIAEEGTPETAFMAFPKSFLTKWCSRRKSEDIPENLDELNVDLSTRFIDAVVEDNETPSLETEYGLRAVSFVVTEALLPDDVQETFNSISEAEALFQVVGKLYGYKDGELARQVQNGDITPDAFNRMLNRAMAISKQRTRLDVQVIEGEFPAAVASYLASQRGGGKPRGGKA